MNIEHAVRYHGGANGLKTILGASLIVSAGELAAVQSFAPVAALSAISTAVFVLRVVGRALVWIGLTHKIKKLFKRSEPTVKKDG